MNEKKNIIFPIDKSPANGNNLTVRGGHSPRANHFLQ